MAKVPKVYFYTPKDQYVNLKGIGNPGDHLYSFSYKYSETKDDTCRAILAFKHTDIDLTFLQPGIMYHIRWGYVGGPLSDTRSLTIKKASYKWGASGFMVVLDLVPSGIYKGEATLRSPDGESLVDGLVDMAKESGVSGYEYVTSAGAKLQVLQSKDGSWKRKAYDSSGNLVSFFSKQDKANIRKAIQEKNRDWNKYYLTHGGLPKNSQFMRVGIGQHSSIPEQLVDYPDVLTATATMLQAHGVNSIVKARDDSIITSPVDWGAKPTFGIVAFAGVISWTAEKADKEAKRVGREAATIDPLDKTLHVTKVYAEKPFRAKFMDAHSKTLIEAEYYRYGDSYYMKPIDIDDSFNGFPTSFASELSSDYVSSGLTRIDKATYEQRKDEAIEAQLLTKKGYSQGDIDKLVLSGQLTKGYAEQLDAKESEREALEERQYLEAWGLGLGAVEAGYVKPLYSGGTPEDLANKAIQETLNQIFYNLKVTIVTEGNPHVEDQVNFTFITGNKQIDYIYHLDESEHSITSRGYTTKLVGYKVAPNVERVSSEISTKVEEGLKTKFPKAKTEHKVIDGLKMLELELGATLAAHQELFKKPSKYTDYGAPQHERLSKGNIFPIFGYEHGPYVDLQKKAGGSVTSQYLKEVKAIQDAGATGHFNPDQTVEDAFKEYNKAKDNE